jgi:hypothetical protein
MRASGIVVVMFALAAWRMRRAVRLPFKAHKHLHRRRSRVSALFSTRPAPLSRPLPVSDNLTAVAARSRHRAAWSWLSWLH